MLFVSVSLTDRSAGSSSASPSPDACSAIPAGVQISCCGPAPPLHGLPLAGNVSRSPDPALLAGTALLSLGRTAVNLPPGTAPTLGK